MYFYRVKNKNGSYSYSSSSAYLCDERFEQMTEEEYREAIKPTEEDIRKEKERQLRKLMAELYPQEEV